MKNTEQTALNLECESKSGMEKELESLRERVNEALKDTKGIIMQNLKELESDKKKAEKMILVRERLQEAQFALTLLLGGA